VADEVVFSFRPEVDHAILIAAFRGWNDAGEAATGAAMFLKDHWEATRFAHLDPEEFFDFQVNRPTVRLVEGLSRQIEWPACEFHHARRDGRDVLVFVGIEPNNRWRGFARAVVDTATGLGAERLVTLGAFLADVPHTRPVPVTGSASTAEEAGRLGLETSRYEGPTGIVGVLHDAAIRSNLPSVSLWAAVPHYAPGGGNPKATLSLVERVSGLLDIRVDVSGLPDAAREWEEAVTEAVGENEALAEYVRRLEEAHASSSLSVNPRAGESLAAEVERFLRERDTGSEGT
jgi:predicted ATP-grasp superfamily ATP-dependent carboligase